MKGDADQDGPTASLVLSDFFKFVYAELSNASIKPNEKQKRPEAHSSSANKRQPTKPYSIDDCRFCFTVPDGLSNTLEYTDLIRAAFKQAGFLKKEDGDNRLIFVNDAVAAGYHCLTKPIFFRSINIDSNYLLVDLGYGLTKFSVIKAKKTEATSSVQSLSNVNGNVGYRGFSENFRNYLIKESETLGLDAANTEEIDKIVASFDAYKKVYFMTISLFCTIYSSYLLYAG